MSRKNKTYFSLGGYGTLLIPVSLLEKIKQEAVFVETEWSGTTKQDQVKSIKPYREIKLWDGEEIDMAEAQQVLQGEG